MYSGSAQGVVERVINVRYYHLLLMVFGDWSLFVGASGPRKMFQCSLIENWLKQWPRGWDGGGGFPVVVSVLVEN